MLPALAYLWHRAHRAIERGRGYPLESRAMTSALAARRRRRHDGARDTAAEGCCSRPCSGRLGLALALLVVLAAAWEALRHADATALIQADTSTTWLCAWPCAAARTRPCRRGAQAPSPRILLIPRIPSKRQLRSRPRRLRGIGVNDAQAEQVAKALPTSSVTWLGCAQPIASPLRRPAALLRL